MQHGGLDKLLLVLLQIKQEQFDVPVHMVETINKLARVQSQLTQELNREPTEEEIAKKLGIYSRKG